MPRFKYYPPYRISYRYDCNWAVSAKDYELAVTTAYEKNPHSLLCIFADGEYGGYVKFLDIGVYAYELLGKTEEEAFEMFDKIVDDRIKSQLTTGHWFGFPVDSNRMIYMGERLYRPID